MSREARSMSVATKQLRWIAWLTTSLHLSSTCNY